MVLVLKSKRIMLAHDKEVCSHMKKKKASHPRRYHELVHIGGGWAAHQAGGSLCSSSAVEEELQYVICDQLVDHKVCVAQSRVDGHVSRSGGQPCL